MPRAPRKIAEAPPPVPELDAFPPRFTREIIGQERAIDSFLEACRGTRLAHAWLLSGPQGVGKASFAWNAAAAFLHYQAPQKIETLGCPQDSIMARYIEQGAHQDLRLITREYNTKRNQFNKTILAKDAYNLRQFFQLKSAHNGWRIAILDSLNDMDFRATNALLKILEEPPEKTLLFLINHHSGRVLDTIASRCRRLAFAPLEASVIARIAKRHFPDTSTDEIAACAHLADGSAGRTLHLLQAGGLALYREILGLLERAPAVDIKQLDALAARFDPRRAPEEFSVFAQLLIHWLERFIRAQVYQAGRGGGDANTFQPLFDNENAIVVRFGKAAQSKAHIENWIALWEKIAHMERETHALNLDKKQTIFEWFDMIGRVLVGGRA